MKEHIFTTGIGFLSLLYYPSTSGIYSGSFFGYSEQTAVNQQPNGECGWLRGNAVSVLISRNREGDKNFLIKEYF